MDVNPLCIEISRFPSKCIKLEASSLGSNLTYGTAANMFWKSNKIRNAAYWHADAHDKQLDLLYAVMVVSLSGSLSLVAHSPLIEIAPPGIYIQSC